MMFSTSPVGEHDARPAPGRQRFLRHPGQRHRGAVRSMERCVRLRSMSRELRRPASAGGRQPRAARHRAGAREGPAGRAPGADAHAADLADGGRRLHVQPQHHSVAVSQRRLHRLLHRRRALRGVFHGRRVRSRQLLGLRHGAAQEPVRAQALGLPAPSDEHTILDPLACWAGQPGTAGSRRRQVRDHGRGRARSGANTLRYSVAGHLPLPVLVSDAGASTSRARATPWACSRTRSTPSRSIELPPAFMLALFSDGILEILPPKNLVDKEAFFLDVFAQTADTPEELGSRLGLEGAATAPDDIAALFVSKRRAMAEGRVLAASEDGAYVLRLVGDVRLTLCASIEDYVEQMLERPGILQRLGRSLRRRGHRQHDPRAAGQAGAGGARALRFPPGHLLLRCRASTGCCRAWASTGSSRCTRKPAAPPAAPDSRWCRQ
jgi:hypothetical protein